MLDYHDSRAVVQDYEREIRHHRLVQEFLKANRKKAKSGLIAQWYCRALSWLGTELGPCGQLASEPVSSGPI